MSDQTTPSQSELTKTDIAQAATNDASLSSNEFTLGDRAFKILDLSYDDYIKFIAHLQPFLDALAVKVAGRSAVTIPGVDLADKFSASALVKFCGASLPEMARIVCAQTDPTITVETIKQIGRTPFVLATVVLRQVIRNGIIQDFADFFGQVMPLLKMTLQ